MGHCIEALIVPTAAVSAVLAELRHTDAVPIGEGLHLVPLPDDTLEALRLEGRASTADVDLEGFRKLSVAVSSLASRVSALVPVAYIETDYFGGTGTQSAVLWESGALRAGPIHAPTGAINSVLRAMGVRRQGLVDEFDTVGLGRARSNESWLENLR